MGLRSGQSTVSPPCSPSHWAKESCDLAQPIWVLLLVSEERTLFPLKMLRCEDMNEACNPPNMNEAFLSWKRMSRTHKGKEKLKFGKRETLLTCTTRIPRSIQQAVFHLLVSKKNSLFNLSLELVSGDFSYKNLNNQVHLVTCNLLTSRNCLLPGEAVNPILRCLHQCCRSSLEMSKISGHCPYRKHWAYAFGLEKLNRKRQRERGLTSLEKLESVCLGEKKRKEKW